LLTFKLGVESKSLYSQEYSVNADIGNGSFEDEKIYCQQIRIGHKHLQCK